MTKTTSNKKSNKYIAKALLVIAVLITSTVFTLFVAKNLEKRKFNNTAQKLSMLVGNISDTSKVISNNHCFHAEQGPFEEGKLWCSVGYIVSFSTKLTSDQVNKYQSELPDNDLRCSIDELNHVNAFEYSFSCTGRARGQYYTLDENQ